MRTISRARAATAARRGPIIGTRERAVAERGGVRGEQRGTEWSRRQSNRRVGKVLPGSLPFREPTMKKNGSDGDGSRAEAKPRGGRGRVARALMLIIVTVAVCATYAYYVMNNLESLAARDLRSLATLTSQLETAIAADRTTLRDYARDQDQPARVIPDGNSPREYDDFEILKRDVPAPLPAPATAVATAHADDPREIVRQRIDYSRGKVRLDLNYEGARSRAYGVVDLNRVVQPFFSQDFLSIFDQVLLVRPDGKVAFATAPSRPSPLPVPHATRADFHDPVSGPNGGIVVTDLGSFSERAGLRKWQSLDVRALRGTSRRTQVRVMDREYYLFTQPLRFTTEDCVNCVSPPADVLPASAASDVKAIAEDTNELLICALVPRGVFRSQALAIPAPVFTIAAGILLLLACCWPFIRIVRLRDQAPLTPPDVVLAALAVLVGGAILAIAVSDTRIFRRLSGIEDKHLATYARKLRADFITDLIRVSYLAEHLRDTVPDGADKNRRSRFMGGADGRTIWEHGPVWRYPYFVRGMWVYPDGRTIVLDAAGQAPPVTDVRGRHFFHELRANRWSTVKEFWRSEEDRPPRGRTPHRFIAEIVRTRDSHVTILAVPPADGIGPAAPQKPVFAVVAPFIHFVDPVVPPGFRFAVIDDRGTVLFHSDRQRSLTENFFRETDDDRHLRSAFFARRDQQIDGRYWGVDHQMYVAPIPDSPWAVVAMRDESLLRSVNTEIVAMTALLLTLYAVLYAFGFALLAVFKPKYRAPWLWPHKDLKIDYGVTICVLTIEVIALIGSMLFLAPGALLLIGFVGPVRGIASAYIAMNARRDERERLKPEGRGRYWWIGVTVSAALTFCWLYAIVHGTVEPSLTRTVYPYVYKVPLMLVVLLAFISSITGRDEIASGVREIVRTATDKVKVWLRRRLVGADPGRAHRPTPGWLRAYQWTGFLMIVIGAVLPALTFLKVASRIGVEARVKWSQLELAGMLERRLNLLERISLREPRIAHDCYGIPYVLDSIWTLDPRAKTERPPEFAPVRHRDPNQARVDMKCESVERDTWVPTFLQTLLPRYSESSVAMRELHHDQTTDGAWHWCRQGNLLTLRKDVTLEPETALRLYGSNAPAQSLLVQSLVPRLLGIGPAMPRPQQTCTSLSSDEEKAAQGYETIGEDAERDVLAKRRLWTWFRRGIYAIAILVAIYVLHSAVGFMARRVFLVDTQEASWLPRDRKIKAGPSTNLFVTHTTDPDALVSRTLYRIRLAETKDGRKSWTDVTRQIDRRRQSDVVIPDFEVGLDDKVFSAAKLRLLEQLLDAGRHTLIVLSRVSATTILSRERGSTRERWARVFDSFMRIDESLLLKRNEGKTKLTHDHDDELCGPFHPSNVSGRIFERDWNDCSNGEKLTLYQLAVHGLANGRNARFVEALLSRHFICRTPALRICCRPFHDFVLSAGDRERLDVEQIADDATGWERLKLPLAFLAIVTISLVVTTQQDVINATSAIITGLAAGLPALIKLVTILTGKTATDVDAD